MSTFLILLKASIGHRGEHGPSGAMDEPVREMLSRQGRDPLPTFEMPLHTLARATLLSRWLDVERTAGVDPEMRGSAAAELHDAITLLTDDQQAVLLALVWIGRGDFVAAEFDQALVAAFERRTGPVADYLLGIPALGEVLQQAAGVCGVDLTDVEPGQLTLPNGIWSRQ
jgi:hypothetical protein